jgi:AcrR family transcriptional regulator
MTVNENRQQARSRATRAKLVKAARPLFARRGYTAVGTGEIARRAGVTRGALYHQFASKQDLFLAVYETVERELTERVAAQVLELAARGEAASPFAALQAGTRVFLEACRTPEVQRIVLVDGPAVLGWERWREVAARYGLGQIEAALATAVEAQEIEPLPVAPLAHLVMGALDEAALLVVREPDATDTVAAALARLLRGLRRPG